MTPSLERAAMRKVLLTSLLVLVGSTAFAAPRLKDKDYVPDGWIDILVNQPVSDRPWLVMEQQCKGMDRETWMEVGREMSQRIAARLKRIGLETVPTIFDTPTMQGETTAEMVGGVLFHVKWYELHKGHPLRWEPVAEFWITGKLEVAP